MNTTAIYILLVTFFGSTLQGDIDQVKWSELSNSPYNGVAIRLKGAYNTSFTDYNVMSNQLSKIKKETKKDILPWVFLNQIIGLDKGKAPVDFTTKQMTYFNLINGIALDQRHVALKDFLSLWQKAMRLAKEIGAPGIVFDPEFYNNRRMNIVNNIATKKNMSMANVIIELKRIGAILADSAHSEYPGATIWSLYTGFAEKRKKNDGNYITPVYIFSGFLERCKEQNYSLKLIAGGELSLGYTSKSLGHLKQKIETRNSRYQPIIELYSPHLTLGGTISLWNNSSNRKGWLKKRDSDIANIIGFETYLNTIETYYDHLWIYAATKSDYDPFNSQTSKDVNLLLGKYSSNIYLNVPQKGK